jgi:hypothetical protein
VHPVRIQVAWQIGRTANPANRQEFVRIQAELDNGLFERVEDAEITASWAPVWIRMTFQIFDR